MSMVDSPGSTMMCVEGQELIGIPNEVVGCEVLVFETDFNLSNLLSKYKTITSLNLNNRGLAEVHVEEKHLIKLEKLSLAGNKELKSLTSLTGKLRKLKELDISDCGFVDIEYFGELSMLEKLNVAGNRELKSLPSSIDKLLSLTELQVDNCALVTLPDAIGNLINLELLKLANNKQLVSFPSSIGKLRSLRVLNVEGCSFNSIPDDIGRLPKLEVLNFAENDRLNRLTVSIGKLRSMKELNVSNCGLGYLPESIGHLQKLESLTLARNHELTRLSASIGDLNSLRKLNVADCALGDLPDTIAKLSSLRKLNLGGNTKLGTLTIEIVKLKSLVVLDVANCRLCKLPDNIDALENLEKLNLAWNEELQYLPLSIGKLQSLRKLDISNCSLISLPETIGDLCNLENLNLAFNKRLQCVTSSIGKLRSLRQFVALGCSLECLPETFGDIGTLLKLNLACNKSLKSLTLTIGNLWALSELNVQGCALRDLPDTLGNLLMLEKLNLAWNFELSILPSSIGKMQSLRELDVGNCSFKNLPESIGDLINLTRLDLGWNEELKCLFPSLEKLLSLRELHFQHCGLTELSDTIGKLSNIRSLDLSGNQLEDYPLCTLCLDKLETLDLSNILLARYDNNENCIKQLPIDLAKTKLKELKLDGNPISEPPMAIWKQGIEAIKIYMIQVMHGEGLTCADTINIIGDLGAGMTSIAQSLGSCVTWAALKNDRTQVMQQFREKLENFYAFQINDFGKNPVCHAVLPLFLPFGGLTIIAYHLEANANEQEQFVKHWLLASILKSTKIRVVVAGTRSDLMSDEQCSVSIKRMEVFVRTIINSVAYEVERNKCKLESLKQMSNKQKLENLLALSSKIREADVTVTAVSCTKFCDKVDDFRSFVLQKLRRPDKIPYLWYLVVDDIFRKRSGLFYLEMEEVKRKYKTHIVDDEECSDLPDILRYLVSSSQIIWLESSQSLCNFVFHCPQKMINVCKQVLDCNQALQLARSWAADHDSDIQQYAKGIMRECVLRMLLSSAKNLDYDVALNFLIHNDIIREIEKDNKYDSMEREFLIPSNLPSIEPKKLEILEQELASHKVCVWVRLRFFGSIISAHIFDTSLSAMLTAAYRLAHLGVVVEVWRNVLIIHYNKVKLIAKCADGVISVIAASSAHNRSPWFMMCPILTALHKNISFSWSAAPPDCMVMCPACRWHRKRINHDVDIGEIAIHIECLCSDIVEGTKGSTVNDRNATCSTSATLACPKCYSDVPRSLCLPALAESYDGHREAITKFYHELESSWQQDSEENESTPKRPKLGDEGRQWIPLSTQRYPDEAYGFSMPSELQSRLRRLYVNLVKSLNKVNVDRLAQEMYSNSNINLHELHKITKCQESDNPACELLDITYARGDSAIMSLAKALATIDMPDLSVKLDPTL